MCWGTSSGRISQLAHYGPIGAIILIIWITVSAFNCLTKWYPPQSTDYLSIINFLIFWIHPCVIFYNYFCAIFRGPGFVSQNWIPANKEDIQYLQYCEICESYKAPRSHHCKKCQRCVLKLDHHCPWINTCVGHTNHASFCYFMFYAILGCIHGLLMLCPAVYRALFVRYYLYHRIKNVPIIIFSFWGLLSSILSIGLAIGVVVAVGFLLGVQCRNIIKNQTGIENWILRKAIDRSHRAEKKFIYPYDLGFKENVRHVFNWRNGFSSIGDGLVWTVRDGSDQYDLTREQLEQKAEKRMRTVRYDVIGDYNGFFFPIKYGFRTCICIPFTDEHRMKITRGDRVLVTRWETYWLYGERLISTKTADKLSSSTTTETKKKKRDRGWFPRCCIYEAFKMEDLWSGKIRPDSDMVLSESINFGPESFAPEGFDENDHDNNSEVLSTDMSSTTTSRKRTRKED